MRAFLKAYGAWGFLLSCAAASGDRSGRRVASHVIYFLFFFSQACISAISFSWSEMIF
jgi:hypothetical protein